MKTYFKVLFATSLTLCMGMGFITAAQEEFSSKAPPAKAPLQAQAQARQACFIEPSSTLEGYEVILYPHLDMRGARTDGWEVPCPA